MASGLDFVLRPEHFAILARGESITIEDFGNVLWTLSPHDATRTLCDLIANAELTDPRGVTEARLVRLRISLDAYLLTPHFDTFEKLREARDAVFHQ